MYLPARNWFVALVLGVGFLAGCRGHAAPTTQPVTQPAAALKGYEYKQVHMGVLVRLVVFAADEQTAEEACRAAYKRIAELDDCMSDYRAGSELNRLCRQAGGAPVAVSEDLFKVLAHSRELSRRSQGAFDVTVGPYVALWRNARKTGQFPTEQELEQARQLVGWQKMVLDPGKRTVQLLVAGMKLDLGGIAKGYAGDCAIEILRQHGMPIAFFEAGGEFVVGAAPPGRPGWIIEVTNDLSGSRSRLIFVKNQAVSTSGDTEQFVVFHGRRYSHIISPLTGVGLTESLLVTVVARNGMTSDGLSTAVSVLGPAMGKAVAKSYSAKTYIRLPGP
jgi:thiamine biosynthesis lipoprotein